MAMKCLPILLYLVALVHTQPVTNCNMENLEIGNAVQLGEFLALGLSTKAGTPTVEIREINRVCLTTKPIFGDFLYTSLLIDYNCTGAGCPMEGVYSLAQMQLECGADGEWGRTVLGNSGGNVRLDPVATLSTPGRNDCAFCVNEGQGGDALNHCIDCNDACLDFPAGLGYCSSIAASGCCDFIQLNNCVTQSCTPPRTHNPVTYVCGFECDDLTESDGVNITYSPNCELGDLREGCVATYKCTAGGQLNVDNPNRTCESSGDGGRWTQPVPECGDLRCDELDDIDDGTVSWDCLAVNCDAEYVCDANFTLSSTGTSIRRCQANADGTQGVWSDSPPSCMRMEDVDPNGGGGGLGTGTIVGIVVGVVGGILLVVIVAVIISVVVVKTKK